MKKMLLLLCLFAFPLGAAEFSLDDLRWMAGHWRGSVDGVEMEEVWLAPRAGVMLGMHRDAKATRASFEFIRIATTPEGIVYFAQPAGRPPTPFRLMESTTTRAVFANPEHDFPQRIIYWLEDGRLCARVEGEGEKAEQWCWTRM